MDVPELLQFPYSHYNEKVRWAFDWKGLAHTRRGLLPGPHMARIRRLTGQTAVPVVRFPDGSVVYGSARIIDELDRLHPERPLTPEDPELRRQALAIQSRFDEEVGPRVRRALFSMMLPDPAYLADMFSTGRSALARRLYRATFPLVKGLMAKEMQTDDAEAVREAFEATREALDEVAKRAGPGGQLVGDAFSVADLTAAALLAPAVDPDHPAMRRPRPQTGRLEEWHARWADHPGAEWVREQYRRHRPTSSEVA